MTLHFLTQVKTCINFTENLDLSCRTTFLKVSLRKEKYEESPVTVTAKGSFLLPHIVGAGVTGTCLILSCREWEQWEPAKGKGFLCFSSSSTPVHAGACADTVPPILPLQWH